MQMRRVGRSGLRVSEVGLGTWLTLGSKFEDGDTRALVERAYDLGINLFDTADIYANGAAEESLGRALRDIPRHHVVIASKCFFPMSERADDRGLSRKHIFESVEGSLRRLQTDYIDLHQCHRADPQVPLHETVRAYEDLVRQGKVLYWGVSNWSSPQLEDACRTADELGAYRPISSQPEYSILRREIEGSLLPTCERLGLGQLVFSPLAQGVLSGKYCNGERPDDSRAADERRNHSMGEYLECDTLLVVEALRPVASKLGVSLAQLALAWCLRTPAVASVIVGATRSEQLEENCKASGLKLPEEALYQIDEISPPPAMHRS
jgi:voltage-dependent potassium channel beta subunit